MKLNQASEYFVAHIYIPTKANLRAGMFGHHRVSNASFDIVKCNAETNFRGHVTLRTVEKNFSNAGNFPIIIHRRKIELVRLGQIINLDYGRYIVICETEEFLNKALAKTTQFKQVVESQKKKVDKELSKTNNEMNKLGKLTFIAKAK